MMETGSILSADVLDIIFDQRNKEYGAYDLRKYYQQRLTKAFLITLLVVVLICLTYMVLGSIKQRTTELKMDGIINLEKVKPAEKLIEKIVPPVQKTISPAVIKTVISTPPLIVKTEVPDDERPHTTDELDNVKIGNTNNPNGLADDGVAEAPVEAGKGVVETPKRKEAVDSIFRSVEIESQYPGGLAAWSKFLYHNLGTVDIEAEGSVIIQFVVDTEGNVSNVIALSGPEELRAAAITAIKKSGKWTPAIQNGRQVKSYKKQPFTFKLPDQ